jgi:hypothetical protein
MRAPMPWQELGAIDVAMGNIAKSMPRIDRVRHLFEREMR